MFSVFVGNFSGNIVVKFGCKKKHVTHFYTLSYLFIWRSKTVGRYSAFQSQPDDTLYNSQIDTKRKNAE